LHVISTNQQPKVTPQDFLMELFEEQIALTSNRGTIRANPKQLQEEIKQDDIKVSKLPSESSSYYNFVMSNTESQH
jgi:hypothetical protein